MKRNAILFSLILMSFPLVAAAADFGAHIGYYDNDVKKAYIGADLSFPIGPIAIMPNIAYWKEHSEGYWLGGGDVVLRYGDKGMAWWLGAGRAAVGVSASGRSWCRRPFPLWPRHRRSA